MAEQAQSEKEFQLEGFLGDTGLLPDRETANNAEEKHAAQFAMVLTFCGSE